MVFLLGHGSLLFADDMRNARNRAKPPPRSKPERFSRSGSAGVSPAVFGVPPKTFARRSSARFGAAGGAPGWSRPGRPGLSRSAFSIESFRPRAYSKPVYPP